MISIFVIYFQDCIKPDASAKKIGNRSVNDDCKATAQRSKRKQKNASD